MLAALFALALGAAQPAETAAPAAALAHAAASAETPRERRRREQAEARATVECREVTPTGSNLPKTACFTRAEWDKIRQDSMDDYRTLNDPARDGVPRR